MWLEGVMGGVSYKTPTHPMIPIAGKTDDLAFPHRSRTGLYFRALTISYHKMVSQNLSLYSGNVKNCIIFVSTSALSNTVILRGISRCCCCFNHLEWKIPLWLSFEHPNKKPNGTGWLPGNICRTYHARARHDHPFAFLCVLLPLKLFPLQHVGNLLFWHQRFVASQ